MPKRKCCEEDNVGKKLRKIEKMLKACKNRRKRIISTSSEGSSQSLYIHSDGELRSPPQNDSDIDSVLNALPPPQSLPPPPATEVMSTQNVPGPSTSQEEEPMPDGNITAPAEDALDEDILEILGEDPTVTQEYSKGIRPELAARFNHIATNGLNKDIRKELCEKYLLPENCKLIGAPVLNAEVKAAINETVLKRDKLIEYRQKRLAAAISCLGEALSSALEAKGHKDNMQIKRLMDATRLLCDAQYGDSVSRRTLAVSSLKKEIKDPLLNTKINKSLFSENLSESLKSAKAISKSGSDLKNQFKPAPTKNWRAGVARHRPPATPVGRRNTPAAPTTPAQTAPWPRPSSEPRAARMPSSRRPPPPPQRSARRRY